MSVHVHVRVRACVRMRVRAPFHTLHVLIHYVRILVITSRWHLCQRSLNAVLHRAQCHSCLHINFNQVEMAAATAPKSKCYFIINVYFCILCDYRILRARTCARIFVYVTAAFLLSCLISKNFAPFYIPRILPHLKIVSKRVRLVKDMHAQTPMLCTHKSHRVQYVCTHSITTTTTHLESLGQGVVLVNEDEQG